jgi:16S rRNA (guanine527-N7)-methyltransferase
MPDAADIAPLEPPPGFREAAAALGIDFDPGDVERLGLYLALLLRATRSFNLTAITDPAEAWAKHILDSLTLVPVLVELIGEGGGAGEGTKGQRNKGTERGREELESARGERIRSVGSLEGPRIIDIGSGGGAPGIPLAIVLPGVHVTLLEATGKKAQFLRETIAALGLTNAAVLHGRAETLGQDHRHHREKYDAAVVRALGHLAIVAELAVPFVRPGGLILAIKGAKAEAELIEARKAIGLLGARHAATIASPTGRIIVLEKATRTPRTYPRRDGEPKRKPLGLP